ncbi:MAG: SUMF1/EgtB/PvdO family nonheme iron enzyme [Candidatus Aphodosoma sp.]
MRKAIFLTVLATVLIITGCSNNKRGQLVGVYSPVVPEATPHGMVHIPRGSFTMGPVDESATWAIQPSQKGVSIDAFWMDITEITNGGYRQFVYWVRDSIARTELARMEAELGVEAEEARYFSVQYDPYNESAEPDTLLNWKVKIPWNARWTYDGDEEANATYLAVNKVFFQSADKLNGKQLNSHVMNYEYEWIAWDQAKKPGNYYNAKSASYNPGAMVRIDSCYWADGKIVDTVIVKPLRTRSDLISRKIINIYPDTLCWLTEYTYSYNEPAMMNYFAHPSYAFFPVVGITWEQATAFCHWRTFLYDTQSKMPRAQEYRLPTEGEWEYAARGGRFNAQYPWGGPYVRDSKGCFMANFKPMRGNYTEDGYLIPSQVGSFDPNDYGLYDMAGNVSEWTGDAYNESLNEITHDFNPSYRYNATSEDPKIMRRKIIKGGSWKDVGAYLQCGMRDFEFQEKCRPSIGFRCIRSHIAD